MPEARHPNDPSTSTRTFSPSPTRVVLVVLLAMMGIGMSVWAYCCLQHRFTYRLPCSSARSAVGEEGATHDVANCWSQPAETGRASIDADAIPLNLSKSFHD